MLTEVLGVAATCSTIARTWPQFVRIAIRKEKQGVSLGTWSLALTNHTAWFVYGILESVPVFIVSNLFAAAGCAATVVALHSWNRFAQIVVAAALATAALFFAFGDSVLLTIIVVVTMSMMLPQLWAVFRSSAAGVSPTAWLVSAMSSILWIAWAQSVHRLTFAAAHFLLLPAALLIAIRTIYSQRRPDDQIDITEGEVAASTAP